VAIPAELLVGTCKALFAFIAHRVVAFTGRDAVGSLGFTFSFACAQTALDAGTLLGWTKGFALVDGVGSDVVALLRAALADAGSRLRVAALVNDTVGTLAAARYADPLACVSVILGTGASCLGEHASIFSAAADASCLQEPTQRTSSSWRTSASCTRRSCAART
jgi:hexokinase